MSIQPQLWERTYDTLALAKESAPSELLALRAQMRGPLSFTERDGVGVASALVVLPEPESPSEPEPVAPEPYASPTPPARKSRRARAPETDETAPPDEGDSAPRDHAS